MSIICGEEGEILLFAVTQAEQQDPALGAASRTQGRTRRCPPCGIREDRSGAWGGRVAKGSHVATRRKRAARKSARPRPATPLNARWKLASGWQSRVVSGWPEGGSHLSSAGGG